MSAEGQGGMRLFTPALRGLKEATFQIWAGKVAIYRPISEMRSLSRDTAVSFAQSGLQTLFFLIDLNPLCLTGLGIEDSRGTWQDSAGIAADTAGPA